WSGWIEEQSVSCRSRTEGYIVNRGRSQVFMQGFRPNYAAAIGLTQAQQIAIIAVAKYGLGDRGKIDRVTGDSMMRREHARGDTGGVHTGYRREDRVRMRIPDAGSLQTIQLRHGGWSDRIGPEPIDDQHNYQRGPFRYRCQKERARQEKQNRN